LLSPHEAIIEPFRIKAVNHDPRIATTSSARPTLNPLIAKDVLIDLLTDSAHERYERRTVGRHHASDESYAA
jgi:hypothetical protein